MSIPAIRWDGNPIQHAGVYAGIPIDDYHRADITIRPSISSSGLKKIWNPGGTTSPAHFFAYWSGNPDRVEEDEEREWMVLGRAAHWLLTGEAGFAEQFVVRPERIGGAPWNGNRTECRAWLKEQRAKQKTVLLPSQVKQITGMAQALGAHPLYAAGAMQGDIERSLVWVDPETGVFCKARPDVIPTDGGDVVDIKTTQSVAYTLLQYTLGDKGYHRQAAWTRTGLRIAAGIKMETFSLFFVEKKFPHCVRFSTIHHEDIDRGEEENIIALRLFARCLESARWPGPAEERADGEVLRLSDRTREFIDTRLQYELPERHRA